MLRDHRFAWEKRDETKLGMDSPVDSGRRVAGANRYGNVPASEEAPLPPKVELAPQPEDAPVVSIRRDESTGDVVEEYRQNGRIYMVKVTPQRGPSYSLIDTNGDGKLDKSDGEGVRPVYWTIYEWD